MGKQQASGNYSQPGSQETADNGPRAIEQRRSGVARLQEIERFFGESGKGGVGSAKADPGEQPEPGTEEEAFHCQHLDQTEQHAPGDVDEHGAVRKDETEPEGEGISDVIAEQRPQDAAQSHTDVIHLQNLPRSAGGDHAPALTIYSTDWRKLLWPA